MRGIKAFGLALVYSIAPFALALEYSFTQNITAQGVNGAVSCENSICSQAGASMLRRGGNAADAVSGTENRIVSWKLTMKL
jgi:hypothetical protein